MVLYDVCGLNPWSASKERSKLCLWEKQGENWTPEGPIPYPHEIILKKKYLEPQHELLAPCLMANHGIFADFPWHGVYIFHFYVSKISIVFNGATTATSARE